MPVLPPSTALLGRAEAQLFAGGHPAVRPLSLGRKLLHAPPRAQAASTVAAPEKQQQPRKPAVHQDVSRQNGAGQPSEKGRRGEHDLDIDSVLEKELSENGTRGLVCTSDSM